MEKKKIEVVAAKIVRGDSVLLCQRAENKSRALLWEFVGGKVEAGETREAALIRECREELDIALCVEKKLTEVTHSYPDITVHLTLFLARTEDEPKKLEHNDIRWVHESELEQYALCPADAELVEKLKG